MSKFIKICVFVIMPFLFVIWSLNTFLLSGSTLIKLVNVNNVQMYTIDIYSYFNNLNLVVDKWKESVTSIVDIKYFNWDSVINCLKSVCNIVIAILNFMVMPFTLLGNVSALVFALLGVPFDNSNWLSVALNSFSTFQIPYLPF